MKKIFLLVVLTALIGSVAYAIMLTKNRNVEKKEVKKKSQCERKSSCAYFQ